MITIFPHNIRIENKLQINCRVLWKRNDLYLHPDSSTHHHHYTVILIYHLKLDMLLWQTQQLSQICKKNDKKTSAVKFWCLFQPLEFLFPPPQKYFELHTDIFSLGWHDWQIICFWTPHYISKLILSSLITVKIRFWTFGWESFDLSNWWSCLHLESITLSLSEAF